MSIRAKNEESKMEKKPLTADEMRESLEMEEATVNKSLFKSKPEIILYPRMNYDCKEVTDYLKKMRHLADCVTSVFVSSYTVYLDDLTGKEPLLTKSSWSRLSDRLDGVKELGSANEKTIRKLSKVAENLSKAESSVYKVSNASDPSHNIYQLATQHRLKCIEKNKSVTELLKKCNTRRKMVEKAQILLDLKAKGEFYTTALRMLNSECQELYILNKTTDMNAHHNFQHLKEILVHFTEVTQARIEALGPVQNIIENKNTTCRSVMKKQL